MITSTNITSSNYNISVKTILSLIIAFIFCGLSATLHAANTPAEVISNWNQNKKYEPISSTLKDSISALVIFNRSYNSYRKYIADNNFRLEIVTTVHRKIKIISPAVLEDFNTVFVPSIGDMFTNNEIIQIKGRTIKPDGSIIELDSSEMRETTLPANAPFFREYNGKVKLLALPGVSVGDEVEYYYTTKTDASYGKRKYLKFGKINFNTTYPSLETSHTIGFNKSFNLQSYSVNTDINFKELPGTSDDELIYFKVTTNNLPATPDESYNLTYPLTMSVLYQIYEDKEDAIEKDWKTIEDFKFVKPSSMSYLTENRTYFETFKKINAYKTFDRKMDELANYINRPYTDKYEIFKSTQAPDLDRYYINAWVHLIQQLGGDINIWYVMDKSKGEFNENIPTLHQFDDVVIEVVNNKTKYHLPLFRPLDAMNEIDYDYHNTKALKIAVDKKKKIKYTFETFVPLYNNTENKSERTYRIQVALGDSSKVTVHESYKNSGESSRRNRYPIYIEDHFSSDADWKSQTTRRIKNKFDDANVTNISTGNLKQKIPTSLTWDIKYDYPLPIVQRKSYVTSISELIGYNSSFSLHCDKRKTEAYLGYPYELDNTYIISADKAGTVLNNDKLNYDFSNDIGFIRSKVEKTANNELKLNIQYAIKKDLITPGEWCSYTILDNAFDNLLKELIVIQQ